MPEWRAQYVAEDGLKRLTREGRWVGLWCKLVGCAVQEVPSTRTYCCVRGSEVCSEGLLVGLSWCWCFPRLRDLHCVRRFAARHRYCIITSPAVNFSKLPHPHKSFFRLFDSRWQCIDTPGATITGDGIELKRDLTEYAA